MLVISRTKLLRFALLLGPAALTLPHPALGQAAAQPAPQAAAQTAQPTWKDQAESDLYQTLSKEADPQKKIALFQQWKEKYPGSAMSAYFVPVYVQAIQALAAPVGQLYASPTPTADQQAAAQKSAEYLNSNLDMLFAPDKKPEQASEADWAKAKKDTGRLAANVPGYLAMVSKDYAKAEAEFTKSLQDDPAQTQSGLLSYWLAQMLFQEKKYPQSMYQYARAASYDGPGSMNAQGRQQVQQSLEKTYVAYHGSRDGLDQLLASAKTVPLPPADFKVASKRELAEQKFAKENADKEKLVQSNPSLALWMGLKETLTGADAQSYFNDKMKGTEIPTEFRGKLIEAKPAVNPKELILAIADGTTPDATLRFETPLRGKMDPGADIAFKNAIASSYTASPFMVTFDVTKENLVGWKGGPAPAAAKPRARTARKK